MDDTPKVNPQAEAFKRELYRRSQDLIRIYNPTDQDYAIDWEGFKHLVPNRNKDAGEGKGQRVIQRFLAEKYAREMKNLLVNQRADKRLQEIKDDMTSKGVTDVIYNANAQLQRENKFRTDDPKLIREIYNEIWLGVEQKYGLDMAEVEAEDTKSSITPIEEQILNELDKPAKKLEVKTDYPINKRVKKQELVDEVAQ